MQKKIILNFLWCVSVCIQTGCINGKAVYSEYVESRLKIKPGERIAVLPCKVTKEIKAGSQGLGEMFDTLVVTRLRNSGYQTLEWENAALNLDTKDKILWGNGDLLNDGDPKKLKEAAQQLQVKYFLRLIVFSHPKEDLMNAQHYFISLKLLDNEGQELGAFNVLYEGEEAISSTDIASLIEKLVKKMLSRTA